MEPFELRFDNNVVEHLGLKLYQNKPTRVIAEVISNSWDAEADEVLVNMHMEDGPRWVSVIDDGHGMCRQDIREHFLVIGLNKRTAHRKFSRPQMGRKGIGKLAPFGIARVVELVSAGLTETGELEVSWLRLKLDNVIRAGRSGTYRLEEVYLGSDHTEMPFHEDETNQVAIWADHVAKPGNSNLGTLVLMRDLTLKRSISDKQMIESLGQRFTVTHGSGFLVRVNGTDVQGASALPDFEFRIPAGQETLIGTLSDGRQVRYWIGFVKSAEWSQDQAGIGIYAHGKIAQDRPFTFGAKGLEIWTRYMYGVVEADWLDELADDLISTDRTTVNWEAEDVQALHEWGRKKVREWTSDFARWRKTEEEKENKRRLEDEATKSGSHRVTEAEQRQIIDLVSRITPRMGKDEDAKKNLIRAVTDAWVQKPMQQLVRDLWSELGDDGLLPPGAFAGLVNRLSAHRIPESLNLAVVFAQRAFALTKLHEYVHHGIEPDLQKLIERFPWIIEPDLAVLTANRQLKHVVMEAERRGQLITGRRSPNVAGVPDRNRPDFVYLSSPEEVEIVVVELKSPQEDLTVENRKQLEDYMTFLEVHYPNASIKGVLVGRNPSALPVKYVNTMKIVEWTEVLRKSRARNIELLAAMLLQSSDGASLDGRIQAALRFGGTAAENMLRGLAEHHEEIRILLEEFGKENNAESNDDQSTGSSDDQSTAQDTSES